jgi:hypothetical protein
LPQSRKCWNGSAGFSGALHGPVAGPVGIGVSGGLNFLGFSYGGSLLDSRLFIQVQAAAMVGGGIYGGVGVQVQGGGGDVGAGVHSVSSWHEEASAGILGGVSAGADYDMGDGHLSSAGGYHGKLPLGRVGAGVGMAAGGGVGTTSTIGSGTFRDALNWLSSKTGLNLPGSGAPATCQ